MRLSGQLVKWLRRRNLVDFAAKIGFFSSHFNNTSLHSFAAIKHIVIKRNNNYRSHKDDETKHTQITKVKFVHEY
jgi:hypothetical protein